MVVIDLIGKRFSRLVVLSREPNDKHGKARWLCQCDCGTLKTIQGREIRIGKIRSCGCLRKEVAAKTAKTRKPPCRRIDPDRTEKYCPGCKQTLPVEGFGKNRSQSDGLTAYCLPCHNRKGQENRVKNWGSSRHYHLVQRYGITAEEADALLEKQGSVCAICQQAPNLNLRVPWHVDHNHVTDKVRGILCHQCNTGLGNFNDDPEILQRALDYLGETNGDHD